MSKRFVSSLGTNGLSVIDRVGESNEKWTLLFSVFSWDLWTRITSTEYHLSSKSSQNGFLFNIFADVLVKSFSCKFSPHGISWSLGPLLLQFTHSNVTIQISLKYSNFSVSVRCIWSSSRAALWTSLAPFGNLPAKDLHAEQAHPNQSGIFPYLANCQGMCCQLYQVPVVPV